MRRHVGKTVALVLVIVVMAGCGRGSGGRRDLEAVRSSGTLRVAVWPGFSREAAGGGIGSGQKMAIEHLAGRLGVSIRWLEPRRCDAVYLALRAGRADIAVVRFAPRGFAAQGIVPTAAVGWVDDLLVAGGARDAPVVTVRLHRSNVYWDLFAANRDGPAPLPLPEEVCGAAAIRRVASGRYEATVVDSESLAAAGLDDAIRVVRVVAERRPLAWYVRSDAPALKTAVDQFLFARHVLRGAVSPPACRDLREVRKARRLRLVTTNGPVTCTVEHGGLSGFEYELVRRFARSLGVMLELSIPPPGSDPLDWLEEGHGDLMALHEPAEERARRLFRVVDGYRLVDLVVVCRRGEWCPAWIGELAGRRVAAAGYAAEVVRSLGLEPAPVLADLPAGAGGLAALTRLAKGDADVAVVGSDLARLELQEWQTLVEGPVAARSQSLAWVLNVDSPVLARRARGSLGRLRRDGTLAVLARTLLGLHRRRHPSRLPEIPTYALTPWDAELKRAALRYGIDWRLLASLMYEESRFDARAVGPGGSAGLFQFMPATWQWLGIRDPFDPAEVIPAAARYLRMLMDDFPDVPLADRMAMAIASYNVGPRHVMDARQLAKEMGLDPDRWRDNVETAMLVLDDPEVASRFPAGVCRCRRAVAYTRRILRRYMLYTREF